MTEETIAWLQGANGRSLLMIVHIAGMMLAACAAVIGYGIGVRLALQARTATRACVNAPSSWRSYCRYRAVVAQRWRLGGRQHRGCRTAGANDVQIGRRGDLVDECVGRAGDCSAADAFQAPTTGCRSWLGRTDRGHRCRIGFSKLLGDAGREQRQSELAGSCPRSIVWLPRQRRRSARHCGFFARGRRADAHT